MNVSAPPKFGMGASPRRLEDGSLIQGKGHYTADYTPEGTLAAFVLRSSAAHARIKLGDLSDARNAPGVHLVWTAADIGDLANMPSLAAGPTKTPITVPPYPVLCGDIVRHVGDAIAFVVADDVESAKSAAEMICPRRTMISPALYSWMTGSIDSRAASLASCVRSSL